MAKKNAAMAAYEVETLDIDSTIEELYALKRQIAKLAEQEKYSVSLVKAWLDYNGTTEHSSPGGVRAHMRSTQRTSANWEKITALVGADNLDAYKTTSHSDALYVELRD
jgi:hypothetical protein